MVQNVNDQNLSDEVVREEENEEFLIIEVSEPMELAEDDLAVSEPQQLTTLVLQQYEQLQAQMVHLGEEFQSKLKYDQHKDTIINNLHRELQEYKNDLYKKLLQPIIMDLIYTMDQMNKEVKTYSEKDLSTLEPTKLLKSISSYAADLEDILTKYGVEALVSEECIFNPQVQTALKVIDTDELSRDKNVRESIKKGYTWEGKLLRKESVSVYKYKSTCGEMHNNEE